MEKSEAVRLLGGTPSAAAQAIGITTQAISLWPDVLPPRIADRVQAALWRRHVAANAQAIGISAVTAAAEPLTTKVTP